MVMRILEMMMKPKMNQKISFIELNCPKSDSECIKTEQFSKQDFL